MRTGWLLAASLVACAAVSVGGRWALSRGFEALFAAWGIDAGNALRAPAWARFLYVWHGSLITVLVSAGTLLLARWLRGLWRLERGGPGLPNRAAAISALAGVLGAALVAALCLTPDSMRLTWPLSRPRLSPALLPLCMVSLIAALAEEALTKGVLYDGLRARRGRAWAVAGACAAFFLMNGGWAGGVVSGVNVLLMGALCCAAYARHGLWAAAGLRWGWSVGTVFLLGNGGGDSAVYRLYGVSEGLLTGGDAGVAHGLWTTLLLCAGIAYFALTSRRQGRYTRSAPDTTRTSKGRPS